MLLKNHKLSLEVTKNSTKPKIREALKLIFNIDSKNIKTMIAKKKNTRSRKKSKTQKSVKKAIITVNHQMDVNKFLANNNKKHFSTDS